MLNQKVSIFVSSPSDVVSEQEKLRDVVSQLNTTLGPHLGIYCELKSWQSHVVPKTGIRAQATINQDIGDYDIYVGIMWKRFGTYTGVADSGTKEEFDIAFENWRQFQRPHIMFYFSQKPASIKTEEEANQWGKVLSFKSQLQKIGLTWDYRDPETFGIDVHNHLSKLLIKWFAPEQNVAQSSDFDRYINYVESETQYVDIRWLSGKADSVHRIRLDDLYVTLRYSQQGLQHLNNLQETPPLENALEKESVLLIKGNPGSGKSTFLRMVAFYLCQRWKSQEVAHPFMCSFVSDAEMIPLLIKAGDFAEYLQRSIEIPIRRESCVDVRLLVEFLEEQSKSLNWRLSADDFLQKLENGNCIIMLDGLDETPNLFLKEALNVLMSRFGLAYPGCRLIVTSRPSLDLNTMIPARFATIEILPLDSASIDKFISLWSEVLIPDSKELASEMFDHLSVAVRCRPEIRLMAQTTSYAYRNCHRLS